MKPRYKHKGRPQDAGGVFAGQHASPVRFYQHHPSERERPTGQVAGEGDRGEGRAQARPRDTSHSGGERTYFSTSPRHTLTPKPATVTPHLPGAGPVLPGQLPQRRDHGGHLQALLGHGCRFETGRARRRRELRDGGRRGPKLLRRPTGGCARPPPPPRLAFNRFATRGERGRGGSAPGN